MARILDVVMAGGVPHLTVSKGLLWLRSQLGEWDLPAGISDEVISYDAAVRADDDLAERLRRGFHAPIQLRCLEAVPAGDVSRSELTMAHQWNDRASLLALHDS